MTKALTTIRLPRDRVNQLRQVAQGMNDATLSEALGAIFKMAREQGLVAHGIPSVQINALDDGLAIKFDEGETVGFSFDEAQRIANEIRNCLAGKNEGQRLVHMCEAHAGSFWVHGRGNAVAIAMPVNSDPKMFTRDLAAELADLLEHEIAKGKI